MRDIFAVLKALTFSTIITGGILLFFVLLSLAERAWGAECEHEIVAGAQVLRSDRGALVYALKEHVVEIASIRVQEGHKREGHGFRLFSEMVKRHPEIRAYEALLMEDNYNAYARAWGDTCAERIHKTPIYRMGSSFGFFTITECEETTSGVWIRVER